VVLIGDGRGNFATLPFSGMGVWLQDDVRSVIEITHKGRRSYVIGSNDAPLKLVRCNQASALSQ
jgi:hypothetical protein